MAFITSPSILKIINAANAVVLGSATSLKFTGDIVVVDAGGGQATIDGTGSGANAWDVLGNAGGSLKLGTTTSDAWDFIVNNVTAGGFDSQGQFLVNGKMILSLIVDPTAGAGVPAPIGSLGLRDNVGAGQLWRKAGSADTAWVLVINGGGGGGMNLDFSNAVASVIDINLNGNKLINVANPTNPQDAATKDYVDSSGGGGANTSLSNLVNPTAVNQSLIPGGALNLGSSTDPWNRLYSLSIANPVGNNLVIETISGEPQSESILLSTGTSPTVGVQTGVVQILTGIGGAGISSGNFFVATGDTADRNSGAISMTTGNVGSGVFGSGNIDLNSGSSPTNSGYARLATGSISGVSTSGSVQLNTGPAVAGNSGDITLDTGSALTLSGAVSISSGSGDGTGNIVIQTGSASNNPSGSVILKSGQSSSGGTGDINLGTSTPGVGTKGKVRLTDQTIFRLATLAADPVTGESGDMYFNTTTSKFRGYDGTIWTDLN